MATIRGTSGDDSLVGGIEDDEMYGLAGDDTLVGAQRNDTIVGGIGNDRLLGRFGNDLLRGGAGDDRLQGEGGDDVLIGEGRDFLRGGDGDDTLIGGGKCVGDDGDDMFFGDSTGNFFLGGAGLDTVNYSTAASAIRLSLFRDHYQDTGGGGFDKLREIENAIGSRFDDTMVGGLDLYGRDGADVLDGNGSLFGGAGDDVIENFTPRSGFFHGGSGSDTLSLSANTALEIDLRVDGAQTITEDGGVATIISIENLETGAGDDTLTGDNQDNLLRGNAGDDLLSGGRGVDVLIGGGESDTMTGGAGRDRFYYVDITDAQAGGSEDHITDFERGDLINVSRIDADLAQDGDQAFLFGGDGTEIGFLGVSYDASTSQTVIRFTNQSATAVIRLQGEHELSAADFLL